MNPRPSLTLLAFICAALLSSCAGGGMPYTQSKSSGALAPHSGRGKVIIYRTPGFAGAASKPYVWVNNVKFAKPLARGTFYTCDAAPGPLNLEFAWHDRHAGVGETTVTALVSGPLAAGLDHVLGHKRHGLNIQVAPGSTHYILFDGYKLSEVTKAEAEEELEDCSQNPSSR